MINRISKTYLILAIIICVVIGVFYTIKIALILAVIFIVLFQWVLIFTNDDYASLSNKISDDNLNKLCDIKIEINKGVTNAFKANNSFTKTASSNPVKFEDLEKIEKLEKLELLNINLEKIIPFTEDKFFMSWNLLPVGHCLVLMYLVHNWHNLSNEINSLIPTFESNCQNYLVHGTIIAIVISSIFSICSLAAQTNKQQYIIDKTSQPVPKVVSQGKKNLFKEIYWWDIRFSESLYNIRFWWVPINMFVFCFVNILAVILTRILIKGLRQSIDADQLIFFFFHPDQNGGFDVLQKLLLALAMIFILTITNTLIASIDHSKQGNLHLGTNTIVILSVFILFFYIFYYPGKIIKEQLLSHHQVNIHFLESEMGNNKRTWSYDEAKRELIIQELSKNELLNIGLIDTDLISTELMKESNDKLLTNREALESLNNNKDIYVEIYKIKKFHLFGERLFLLLFTFILPFFGYILPKLSESFKKRELI